MLRQSRKEYISFCLIVFVLFFGHITNRIQFVGSRDCVLDLLFLVNLIHTYENIQVVSKGFIQ